MNEKNFTVRITWINSENEWCHSTYTLKARNAGDALQVARGVDPPNRLHRFLLRE